MQQYQEIFMKLVPKLRDIYGKRIENVILYGSVARGADTPESDIDIAVILHGYTKEMHDEMLDFLVDLELEFDKVISVLLIDYDDYQEWQDVMPFYKNMRKEGVSLWQAA
ncbi:MAG: nucleotidyltransferase domain-containing protein [Phascolarctobacterium sp.]